MRLLKFIPMMVFIAINLLVIVAMIFCALTAYLPPRHYSGVSYWGLAFPVFLVLDVLFVVFWLIFKWRLVALPLGGMLLCASSIRTYCPFNFVRDVPEGSLKILSYNTMSFGADYRGSLEENSVYLYIKNSGADIVCLQEAMKAKTDEMAEVLCDLYPYTSLRLVTDNYMVCFSKYPIIDCYIVEYPSDKNASYVYEVKVNDDTLLVVNNHLESYKLTSSDKDDYKSIIKNYRHPDRNDSDEKYQYLTSKLTPIDSLRGIQADSLAAFVERNEGKYLVLCGDFNASPISYPHYRLTRSLNDAYTRSGNGPGVSYNRSGMYFRLDNILISPNIKAYGAKVDNTIKASDHYPIYTYIKLGGK